MSVLSNPSTTACGGGGRVEGGNEVENIRKLFRENFIELTLK